MGMPLGCNQKAPNLIGLSEKVPGIVERQKHVQGYYFVCHLSSSQQESQTEGDSTCPLPSENTTTTVLASLSSPSSRVLGLWLSITGQARGHSCQAMLTLSRQTLLHLCHCCARHAGLQLQLCARWVLSCLPGVVLYDWCVPRQGEPIQLSVLLTTKVYQEFFTYINTYISNTFRKYGWENRRWKRHP